MREATELERQQARHDRHREALLIWFGEHSKTLLRQVVIQCSPLWRRAGADPGRVMIHSLAAFALDDLALSMLKQNPPAESGDDKGDSAGHDGPPGAGT